MVSHPALLTPQRSAEVVVPLCKFTFLSFFYKLTPTLLSGGVLLGTTLLHLVPEVIEDVEKGTYCTYCATNVEGDRHKTSQFTSFWKLFKFNLGF